MSSIFDNVSNKDKCQKFTPLDMVQKMLDLAGYTTNLIGKRVLENSFGSGNILVEVVRRYIQSCLNQNMLLEDISKNLAINIYGIELDNQLYNDCLKRLNQLSEEYHIPPVNWHLYNTNALTWESDVKFDLVIGNPPYITYKDIDLDSRTQIRQSFSSCAAGKFDYCYAFIESGIKLLSASGKLVQLVPSNIYKNVFAEELRMLLKPYISVIFEYPSKNIFAGALTSTSIFLYDKCTQEEYVQYQNITEDKKLQIPRTSLSGKWMFANISPRKKKVVRFGDVFNASIVIATLLNAAFILTEEQMHKNKIEETILRLAVSPRSLRYNRKEYIIFPYRYQAGQLERMEPEAFRREFPMTVQYLNGYLEKLNARKKDVNTQWFEYGRSQALAHLNQQKLLMSTVVTNNVELYELDINTIPYSGIYIISKNEDYDLNDAKKILQSKEFLEYVQRVGISVSGKSIRITCKDINNFEFVRR
ncbi:MAG: N-6 DNA methylase [Lachnospiraceae bacterium]|nr:N-6 DNA methylase [Lachnospiraceae bacterium]